MQKAAAGTGIQSEESLAATLQARECARPAHFKQANQRLPEAEGRGLGKSRAAGRGARLLGDQGETACEGGGQGGCGTRGGKSRPFGSDAETEVSLPLCPEPQRK